jgi:hypothetical protein
MIRGGAASGGLPKMSNPILFIFNGRYKFEWRYFCQIDSGFIAHTRSKCKDIGKGRIGSIRYREVDPHIILSVEFGNVDNSFSRHNLDNNQESMLLDKLEDDQFLHRYK